VLTKVLLRPIENILLLKVLAVNLLQLALNEIANCKNDDSHTFKQGLPICGGLTKH